MIFPTDSIQLHTDAILKSIEDVAALSSIIKTIETRLRVLNMRVSRLETRGQTE